MPPSFFPNPYFGWAFVAVLTGLLTWASSSDLKSAVIPKNITLTMAAIGLMMNLIRCGWLGQLGMPTWLIKEAGPAFGAVDGLLFAIAGFVFGFIFFMLLWLLGVAGGGDVKFFAAIGAWVGPLWAVFIVVGSLLIMLMIVMFQAFKAVATGNRKALRSRAANPNKPTVRLVTFGLPLSVATILVLAWKVQHELNLKPAAGVAVGQVEGVRHAG
ncbi:MAG: A24 family peptidase [Gemmataceae bacterium]|nr:A24 family peptidase [Gemmataceae bacterium]